MTNVAVLGTGIMGAPMARNIASAGHDVRVWNRSRDKAEPLADAGIAVADTAAEAVSDADVIVTMLSDGQAVADVMRDAADGFSPGAVWLQMSTVGVKWCKELEHLGLRLKLRYVDCPVLGTRQPAESGQLTVLASTDVELPDDVGLIFDAVGSRTMWLGGVGQASRLKLVANSWIIALTAALAESIALADHLEVDARQFLDAISGGPVGVPYAGVKGQMMVEGEYPTSFPARLAGKDASLIVDAGGELPLRVAAAAAEHYRDVVAAGHGGEDMAAVRRAI